ncbi:prephenate dehydrogenase [Bombilactobacillus bombi]|uniref:prephenate dehydrogenase n=1 Tax=Bombilactobacillus bombi TaxID=1303590 RepID=UPI0015E5A104|nr:prephenate dehydrogenase [Bombilactobacillus bombi]MBA1433968.1 prephenate dehydrogenase [Bombilactobacillus bombi]
MQNILIKGLGLIGSSLALVIKKAHPDYQILGYDIDSASLNYAQQRGIIDKIATNFAAAALQADVIILAAPAQVIISDLKTLANLPLKPHVLISDVGSTKQAVIAAAQPLQKRGITFIGGHPMAGSHKSKVTAGRTDLFENAFYFLIPSIAPASSVSKLQDLLQAAHVKWLTVTPKQHDRIVGQISHLPHIVAAALVNQTQQSLSDYPLGLRLAAGGFKSITRIASSDPQMWSDILSTNRSLLIVQLQAYIEELLNIKKALTQQDVSQITDFFNKAKVTRDHLGPEQLGSLPNFFDLFLNIPDQVGALAQITHLLSQAQINLVNIHILEIREDIDGVLQLTFSDASTQAQAAKLLKQSGYQILRRN